MASQSINTPPTSQVVQSRGNNPAATTNATKNMVGLGVTMTLQYFTRVLITIEGEIKNNTIGDGTFVVVQYGTGAAPANAAASTGTVASGSQTYTASTAAGQGIFSLTGLATGLTVGTTYWFDLGYKIITGGTGTISNVQVTVQELP